MPEESRPFVSVVLPVRNEGRRLARCLEAVLSQAYPKDCMEVLVVDGLSGDGTRQLAEEYARRDARVRFIENPAKVTPAALNIGIREAKGEVLVRVDGHTLLEPDYFTRCVEALERTGASCVGGLMRATGEGYWGKVVTLVHSSRFGLGGGRFHLSQKEGEVDTVYLGAYRREVFQKVGLFNERLVRNQDIEFNGRLRAAGGRIVLSPAIRSLYYVRGSLGAFLGQNFRNGQWNVAVLHETPWALSLRHLVPFLFVSTVGLSLALSPWVWPARVLLGSVLLLYGLLALGAAIWSAVRGGARYLPGLVITFPALHLAYGLGFAAGLLRFGVPRALVTPTFLLSLLQPRRHPPKAGGRRGAWSS
ncbi:MAG: glycosyltransferase family 2 protein [Chloroflexi bacterium]|nr:glycosyltransferase family 2 protein [Chloroflexota bacterium]